MSKPVGELKKLVSLVDRSAFDEFVYPKSAEHTVFQSDFKSYHNFTNETTIWTFSGSPAWGQRITFSVPWPWQADFLNSVALRLKPFSWLPPEAQRRIGPEVGDWELLDPDNFYVWANSLGTIAIQKAELEVNGVIVEQFSGDWLNIWNKTTKSVTRATPFDDAIYCSRTQMTKDNFMVSDDGYVYCYLPFMFTKFRNVAFPLLSCKGPDTVRIHITLRPFKEVIRKLKNPLDCDETLVAKSFQVRDYSFPFRKFETVQIGREIPGFLTADLVCSVSNIDGELRKAYIEAPHEIMYNPVVETVFATPLKYAVNISAGDTVKVQLPLTEANGPLRQILFFLRRKAVTKFNDWNNYSAQMADEVDPVWNPERPLLQRAQLQVGTAVWADAPEDWWRAESSLNMAGGVRAYGNYIYGYNFASEPDRFDPTGSINASRLDIRLNLTVAPPGGAGDGEWSVHVFLVGTNWLRFQNGLANNLFMD